MIRRIGKRRLTRGIYGAAIGLGLLLLGTILWTGVRGYWWAHHADTADFAARWERTAEDQRHRLVGWLLNAEPKPHTTYRATRLHGMHRRDVEALLGKGIALDAVNSYRLGSIAYPQTPGLSLDWLCVEYDANHRVITVRTNI